MSHHKLSKRSWLAFILALGVMLGAQPAGIAYAATITVNTGFDEDLGNGGTGCSLREAIIAANTDAAYNGCPKGKGTDTISFSPNLPAIVLGSNLPVVTSNISFVGPKFPADSDTTTVVEGGFNHRSGFEITTANISVTRMTFQNGFDAVAGGAISQTGGGTLAIYESTFFNNFANTNGGAIFLTDTPSLTITNSIFSDNASGDYGGAIYVLSGMSGLKITGSSFLNSTADDGGAINVDGPLRGTVSITNSTLRNNVATTQGGFLRAVDAGSTFALTISDSTLQDNDAMYGVALVNVGKVTRLTISDSEVTENDAGGSGGAFWFDSLGPVSVKNSTFDTNTAGFGFGGVIYANILAGSLSFSKSDFTDNSAGSGGVFYVDSALPTSRSIQFAGGSFTGNKATDSSGGMMLVYGFSGAMKISGALFDHNDASDSGGVLSLPGANLKSLDITNATFSTNHAFTGHGGAINVGLPVTGLTGAVAKMSISKSSFTGNGAGSSGGAIYLDSVTSSLTIGSGTLFQNNGIITGMGGSGGNGGAIDIAAVERFTITGADFVSNLAGSDGGALHITQLLGPLTIASTNLSDNSGPGGGGAIRIDEANLNLVKVTKTIFEDNTALVGGALTINDANTSITGSSFIGNLSTLFGGAIYTHGPNSTLTIASTVFVTNTALNDSGGAIMANGTILDVSKTLFWHNSALGYGDAVSFDLGELHNNCFEGNGSPSVNDAAGGNDVTQNWWNDPNGPNQGTADTYQTASVTSLFDPWLTSRPACPPLPAP